jgi:AraC-like DNA-binding protein
MADTADAAPALRSFWALTSEGFEAGRRFEAWHAALSPFNDVCVGAEDRAGFRAATSYWALGDLTLAVNEATKLRLVRPDAQAAREGLEHEVVVVGLAGSFTSTSQGAPVMLEPGRMLFGSLRRGYDFASASPGVGRWADVTCPPATVAQIDALGSGRTVTGRRDTPRALFLARFVQGLARQVERMTERDAIAARHVLLGLMAAARTDPSGGPARLSLAAQQAVGRARAAAAIERELHSARLSVERVTDLTGIPRTTLYRLFATEDGVAAYIRARRLEALRGDLADRQKRHIGVAALAEARGFHCLSTLNRAFRERYGCTPSELRGRAAANAADTAPAGIAAVIEVLRGQGPA